MKNRKQTQQLFWALVFGKIRLHRYSENVSGMEIWLYQNGYVDTLILTGGYSSGNSESDAQIAKNYSIEQGVPATDILIEEDSLITQKNLYYAKRIMEEYHFKNTLIVSDSLHMKRAILMAEDMDIECFSSPTPTSLKSKFPFFL